MKKKAASDAIARKMNPVVSGMMMTGTIFGSATMLLPGVASQISDASYFIMLFFYVAMVYACTMLANYVFGDQLSKTLENDESLRRPLQYCTEHAFGKKSWLNVLFSCVQISSNLSLVFSSILLVAKILESALPALPVTLNPSNLTRIWLLITFAGLLPFQMIGSFKELGFFGPSAVFFQWSCIILSSRIRIYSTSKQHPSTRPFNKECFREITTVDRLHATLHIFLSFWDYIFLFGWIYVGATESGSD